MSARFLRGSRWAPTPAGEDCPVRCVEVRDGTPQHVPLELSTGDRWQGEQCDGCGSAEYILERVGVRCVKEEDEENDWPVCGRLVSFQRRPASEVQF